MTVTTTIGLVMHDCKQKKGTNRYFKIRLLVTMIAWGKLTLFPWPHSQMPGACIPKRANGSLPTIINPITTSLNIERKEATCLRKSEKVTFNPLLYFINCKEPNWKAVVTPMSFQLKTCLWVNPTKSSFCTPGSNSLVCPLENHLEAFHNTPSLSHVGLFFTHFTKESVIGLLSVIFNIWN